MYVLTDDSTKLAGWIRDEIEFKGDISMGRRGMAAKRVQEWLNFHGFGVTVDADFGGVTKRALVRFQESTGLDPTGVADEETFDKLVEPMRTVLAPLNTPLTVEDAVLKYATTHLDQHPIELGGQNCGPWVRLYMKGNEGTPWAWCAGFVMFILHQANDSLETTLPIDGSFSCDSLAAQGREAGLFLPERDVTRGQVPVGSIFLVRRTPNDWIHTGLVIDAGHDAFETIEGNTNDDGHREGFEVCARSRGYRDKDFVLLSAA